MWRFCTDLYDIGFGLDYELTETSKSVDPDAGGGAASESGAEGNKIETIVPVARKNSHEELQLGANIYSKPGNWFVYRRLSQLYHSTPACEVGLQSCAMAWSA